MLLGRKVHVTRDLCAQMLTLSLSTFRLYVWHQVPKAR